MRILKMILVALIFVLMPAFANAEVVSWSSQGVTMTSPMKIIVYTNSPNQFIGETEDNDWSIMINDFTSRLKDAALQTEFIEGMNTPNAKRINNSAIEGFYEFAEDKDAGNSNLNATYKMKSGHVYQFTCTFPNGKKDTAIKILNSIK